MKYLFKDEPQRQLGELRVKMKQLMVEFQINQPNFFQLTYSISSAHTSFET